MSHLTKKCNYCKRSFVNNRGISCHYALYPSHRPPEIVVNAPQEIAVPPGAAVVVQPFALRIPSPVQADVAGDENDGDFNMDFGDNGDIEVLEDVNIGIEEVHPIFGPLEPPGHIIFDGPLPQSLVEYHQKHPELEISSDILRGYFNPNSPSQCYVELQENFLRRYFILRI